jgi:tRNA(His) guanylyltransferase
MTAGSELEARMRCGEVFHSLRVPPGAFIVIRVDGRSFARFTERMTQKPFDAVFHDWMVASARALVESFGGLYAYTESDEISVLLPRASALFDREVEKLVSLAAARTASTFSLACGEAVEFDARIWVGVEDESVVDYFAWRQGDAARCALNGWCYWTLRNDGKSVAEATAALERTTHAEKNELLHRHGINFNTVPAWQRRGTGVRWESYEKEGVNPKTGAKRTATRRRLVVDDALPMKAAYRDYVAELLR